ncbi:RidA family protein [Solihabitans fulvus]|uniref:RidA family protein n=1 Tax=Solihabitans fulvus TaxID=1892852 RepID=A0A5B2WUS2_9PSEU|nr:Rid family detoxifying hydrolase [Solihabitans fulvus]KAA2254634.1 RidA family protein [Solihabitans fulvus]
MKRTPLSTPDAPAPIACYSQGARVGNFLQVSGQMPADPATGELVGPTVKEQTRQSLLNVQAVLTAAGATFDNVLMMRVYLTTYDDFWTMNEVYSTFFENVAPPARMTFYCGLPPGMLVEVDALAVLAD